MLRRTLAAAFAATMIVAAPAAAATDLGQTTASSTSCGPADQLAWMTSAPYLAPSKGVITQLRASAGTPAATISLKVVRPAPSATILFSTAPQTVANAGDVVSVNVRVPVEAGDTIGEWLGSDNIGCYAPGTGSDTFAGVSPSSDQPAGPVAGTLDGGSAFRLAVAARFEADGDNDGYGDDTQDSCPADPAVHDGPCVVDAAVTAKATPSKIELGDIAVIAMSASNPGPGTVRGATLTAALPAGLSAVLASPNACALAPAFSCPLGDFAAGSREAVLVVKAKRAGSYAIPVSVASANVDSNTANNTVKVPLKVSAKSRHACTVPKLKGRTKSFASALLKAAGCRLGKTKTKKVKKGKNGVVASQTRKPGTNVSLGTRVGITLTKLVG